MAAVVLTLSPYSGTAQDTPDVEMAVTQYNVNVRSLPAAPASGVVTPGAVVGTLPFDTTVHVLERGYLF